MSNMGTRFGEETQIDADGWPPEIAVSGSLGLLLSLYQQTPTPLFHVCTSTPGQLWDAGIAVNHDCSAHDFLESVRKNTQLSTTLPAGPEAFWLRTDSFQNWETSNSRNSAIPRQILCTVRGSQTSRLLKLEIIGKSSPANEKFLSQLVHVVKQLLVATKDGRMLRALDLICDLDRQDLQRWNKQPPSTIASTVHEMFRQRVLESPESQAVESWDGWLTYRELDTLSSRVCSLLLSAGARQSDCIPLCFEKTLWTTVAMLGVLKSGCSFMLMDVSHPTSRLQALTKETKATIILSSSAQEDRAISLAPRAIVVSASSLSTPSLLTPSVEVSPHDGAAVIFTSGTTGTPKGIQLEHESLCSSLVALAQLSGINKQTRYFQFSSYAFDAAFGEILMTLMHGGCVCIPSNADRLNKLAESIRNFNANAVLLTPTVVRLLSLSDVPCLTTLISGGEKVTQDIVGLWEDKLDLIIAYGPAESTVACIAKKARSMGDDAARIGFPVNSRAWIARLDDPNQLAPVGAIGELVVEGPGIARGYINNEAGNAKLFLNSLPWAKESIGRAYRTGDLVRYADDGELVFIGRRDRQVNFVGKGSSSRKSRAS
ncbi:Nonribosomal Peptide Synthase (NRPS) [Arthroderma uncinatum]|uniref:Nonribosomal Peptide Synthase (NRPS) n=1 Tax=Arthroderma uncinatum TaxID=74035 RepID=UPI00144AC605|nr:Nonribosomal Peptide Synthase (NRPS) [Arthroderma uncinatum]KAF3492394.1 Nonribosomal Peptide Synthase (NRPS) [Arthroderma uncinatum]